MISKMFEQVRHVRGQITDLDNHGRCVWCGTTLNASGRCKNTTCSTNR